MTTTKPFFFSSMGQGVAGNPLAAQNEFVNNKLTAKAVRQLQGVCMYVCM